MDIIALNFVQYVISVFFVAGFETASCNLLGQLSFCLNVTATPTTRGV